MKKQIVINPYSTDAGVTNSVISHLINSDVKLVRGYSQFLYNLCQLMKVLGVKPRLSPHRLNIFLNTVRCETHRAKLEDILEQRQPEKSDFFHIKSLYSILYVLGKG